MMTNNSKMATLSVNAIARPVNRAEMPYSNRLKRRMLSRPGRLGRFQSKEILLSENLLNLPDLRSILLNL